MKTTSPVVYLFEVLLAIGALLALSACEMDPAPDTGEKARMEAARYAVTKIGPGFELDGCQVQPWRVNVTGPTPNFTVASVHCPTGKVTTTAESCGKNCVSEYLMVQSTTKPDVAPVVTAEDVQQLRERNRMKQEMAELQARMAKLQTELNKQ